MRYWAYFAAKLILAAGILYASLGLLNPLAPHDSERFASTPAPKNSLPAPSMADGNLDSGVGQPQPGAEIQVEIAQPQIDAEVAKSPHKTVKEAGNRELVPLTYGGEYLAINLALMVWFLFGAGMLYLIVYDQRYRCRVCLRKLRMPVETGSRGFMLQMGRPRIEYICPYGHGTLKQEEFQTSGLENPEWTAHTGDMWDELYAAGDRDREQK